jgi:MFS family permease
MCCGIGAVLIFINFLALRQSVTPRPLLGRMTSTMRWLILLPAPVGAVLGGWLGEHLGLRYALGAGGFACLAITALGFLFTGLRHVRQLPQQAD